MWSDVIITFMIAFIASYICVPISMKLAKKVGAIDLPNEARKKHKIAMPRLRRYSNNNRIFSCNNLCYYDKSICRRRSYTFYREFKNIINNWTFNVFNCTYGIFR